MKAMIFAAGLGTRLKPLTDTTPKALVPICGKPMLQHVIEKLKASGFDDIIINVHHFPQQIIDFLAANNDFGIKITISDESDMLLDTGGGMKKAMKALNCIDTPILFHNVDILSDCNLNSLVERHIANGAIATLLVSSRSTQRYLLFDKQMRLHGWVNKATGATKPAGFTYLEGEYLEYAYSGIEVANTRLTEHMTGGECDGKFSIIDFYLNNCNRLDIRGYAANNLKIIDIGKPDTLHDAETFLQNL
ncbi:MAG: NDP-sugar synthase [Muribaculaceae bacterium]